MSSSLGSVVVAIKAVDQASSVMDKVRASTSLLGSAFQGMGGAIGSVGDVMQGFAAGGVTGAAIAAVGEVTQGLKWAIGQATEAEQAIKNLSAAVERSGTSWESVSGKTQEYMRQVQKTTVYSDEAIAGMIERLLTFGMTYDEAMKAAGAALDLAAAKHMDLESAATLVGKAVEGNTAVLKRYGVDIEVAKDATDKFTPVITALNEQFGGAAQEQAKTYAGIQERLKNATSDLGEKIGGIVLPALAGMTEAMIPVVDWLGKGVDAVGNWLTEVGKMPEVKGFVEAAQGAFDGFWKALEGFWGFLSETFGPVLQELGGALREVFDALAPIGEAFAEVWAAITGGQEGGDWLKDFLKFVAQFIREEVVPAIKAAVPVIKAFADVFKDAADFALPIITQIKDAVVGFIDALKDAFYGFYTWLVGGSLWQDMWNTLASVASTMIGALLGDLGSKFFEPMKSAFLSATEAVERTWDASWDAIQTTFDTITSAIQTDLNTRFDEMKTFVTENLGEYAPIANDALSGMQSAMNAVMALIHGDWQGFLDGMGQAMYLFWNVIQGATTTAFSILQNSFTGSMDAIKGILDGAISFMQGAWGAFSDFMSRGIEALKGAISGVQSWLESTYASMQATASAEMSALEDIVMAAVNAIVAAAQSLWSQLVGGSIWTDLMETMQSQAYSALGNIAGAFQGMSLAVPATIPYSPPAAISSGSVGPAASPGAVQTFSFTIPVTVTLDGQVISRQVEQRIVERVSLRGKKVA
jgi:hypothetical protein